MAMFKLLALLFLVLIANAAKLTEQELESHLDAYNIKSIETCRRYVLASWNVATDIGNTFKEKEKVWNSLTISMLSLKSFVLKIDQLVDIEFQ